MKAKIYFIATAIILIIACQKSFSQESAKNDSMYFITTKDGTTINGTLHEKNEKQISINTRNFGMVTVQLDSIKLIQALPADSYKNGKFFFPNPNSTRYFISPSAIPLNKGEGYFQNTYLFLCTINYGVTKNISIGGGTDVISPFIKNSGGPTALLNLKAGFKVARFFYAGGTTIFLRAPVSNDETGKDWSTYLLEDATFTAGNADNNLTLGASYGLKNGGWQRNPTFTLSGMARVTPRFSFVSENWMLPVSSMHYDPSGVQQTVVDYEFIFSYGMRFMSQKIAVDFGFINQKDIAQTIFIGIPYVDFVVKF